MHDCKLITLKSWTYLHHRYRYSISEHWCRPNYKYNLVIKLDNKVVKIINWCKDEKRLRVYVKWFIDSLFIRLDNVSE